MPNLDDVLVEHRHVPCCTRDFESDCIGDPVRKPEGCKGCDYSGIDLTGCKRCAQEELLAWQRENCKLTLASPDTTILAGKVTEIRSPAIKEEAMRLQLSKDQQTINKILGVE